MNNINILLSVCLPSGGGDKNILFRQELGISTVDNFVSALTATVKPCKLQFQAKSQDKSQDDRTSCMAFFACHSRDNQREYVPPGLQSLRQSTGLKGNSLLHLAADAEDEDPELLVQYLLNKGADASMRHASGRGGAWGGWG